MGMAERIRALAAARHGNAPVRRVMSTVESQPPGELVAPLIGRVAAFGQLVTHYQQARQGQAQAVLVVGEAGIGKTRPAPEFWARAPSQGAGVLSGPAFEGRGQPPPPLPTSALPPPLE